MTDIPPAVAANFKDTDPTKIHEWESASIDELLPESPPWTGPAEPGSFPDYDAYNIPVFEFPPPESLPDANVPDTVHDGFEDRPFRDVFTQHPGLWDEVGRPSRAYNLADIVNAAAAATTPTRLLMQGSGVLYGVTAYSVVTAVTPFTVLTDSLDGNGPVLMVFSNGIALTGFTPTGHKGIEFQNGLCLANLTTAVGTPGAQIAVIPIIRRRHVISHVPTA